MYVPKFRVAVVVIILSAIICIGATVALLEEYYVIIPSSGMIGLPVPPGPSVTHSEIRAVLVHGLNMPCDYETICETLKNQGVDMLLVEIAYAHGTRYPSAYVPQFFADQITPALNAAHARGMEIHLVWCNLLGSLGGDYSQIDAYGNVIGSNTCPIRGKALQLNLAEEMATYQAQSGPHAGETVDGIMYDYIRYGNGEAHAVCYCDECKAAFAAWLDEGPITDWTPFLPGGARDNEYKEWRTIPINELVEAMTNRIRTVAPNCEISAAVWAIYNPAAPAERRWWLGQDFTYWIKEGWLDWVNVMAYTTDLTIIGNTVLCTNQYTTGGPEGKIPGVINLANCFPGIVPPNDFKAQIDTIRAQGADGWVIWRYGGPGDNPASGAPDIRDYLNLIDMYPTFSVASINALPTSDSCTITWTTDLPATSEVEYSISPLFNATKLVDPMTMGGFEYWDVDHVSGTVIEEATPLTDHSITLPDLLPATTYYFRVQSQDANGIATSKVHTFQTSGS